MNPSPKPLTIALAVTEPLAPAVRRGWAAVLARTGIPIRPARVADAEAVIAYGESIAVPSGKPVLMVRRESAAKWLSRWRDRLQAVSRVVAAGEPLPAILPDLPQLAEALLHGWEEEGAPRDEHGRFPPEASQLVRDGVIGLPLLDVLARRVGEQLWSLARPNELPPKPRWYFCLTLDIDSAGMFRGRAALRSLFRIAREHPGSIPSAVYHSILSNLRMESDPHLLIRRLGEMLEGMDAPATFLVQTHRRHRLDSYRLRRGTELARQMEAILVNGLHEVGLHSSYATTEGGSLFLLEQLRRLRRRLGREITPVHRSHYLRFPNWMRIPPVSMVDSSLGFGAREGFRRATAYPFRLSRNCLELPPAVMDTTLRYYRGLEAGQARRACSSLMRRVADTGGAFVAVFHPNNMDPFLWPGWADVPVDLLREAKSLGGEPQSLARAARSLYNAEATLGKGLDNILS